MRLPVRQILIAMLSFSVLTTSGCAKNEATLDAVELARVDLAPQRCPPLVPADVAPFSARAAPPAGAVTAAAAREWIDRIDLALEASQRAGKRLAKKYEACRGGQAAETAK